MTTITRHADRQLRQRTGWKRSAVQRAVESVEVDGVLAERKGTLRMYRYRGLLWIVDEGRIVTVIPGSAQSGKQSLGGR